MLGFDMFYNHNATPNIEFQTFGREPMMLHDKDDDDDAAAINAQGFVALRNIQRGEELFSTYKSSNEHDGGVGWFRQRGITLQTLDMSDTRLSADQLENYPQQYCSKITATISSSTWQQRIMTLWPPQPQYRKEWMKDYPLLPSRDDAGWAQARAKQNILSGERIEMATALVLSYSQHVKGTALRPISYTWHDLYPPQQQVLQQLRDQGQLHVQYQGPSTEWRSVDGYMDLQDVVLFPAAGNIGMVQRTYHHKEQQMATNNCRLVLHGPLKGFNNEAKVTVTIELIATHDIAAGELLILDVPIHRNDSPTQPTRREFQLLYRELLQSGQLFDENIFRHFLQRRQGDETKGEDEL